MMIYPQTPQNILTSVSGATLHLADFYQGGTAFLIAGGPSLRFVDLNRLKVPGCNTMAVNNAAKTFRPNLWICVDAPDNFLKSVWLDSTILKFVPTEYLRRHVFDSMRWEHMDLTVADCPGVIGYRRNERFNASTYLTENSVNWGDHARYGGGRSVLLAAIRILYYLGIRRIFLIGVDFHMTSDYTYHFEQSRCSASVSGNMHTYEVMKGRFEKLLPLFERSGLEIMNCNLDSKLTTFPFIELSDAIAQAQQNFAEDLEGEPTQGLYNRSKSNSAELPIRSYDSGQSRWRAPQVYPWRNISEDDADGSFCVVVAVNGDEEWLFKWWFSNFRNFNDYMVTVVDLGVSKKFQNFLQSINNINMVSSIPFEGSDYTRQDLLTPFLLRSVSTRYAMYIDIACEILGPLSGVIVKRKKGIFALAKETQKVGSWSRRFSDRDVFNSSVIWCDVEDDFVSDWIRLTELEAAAFSGGQEILNTVLQLVDKQIVELPARYNRSRHDNQSKDEGEGSQPLVLNWTGPQGRRILWRRVNNKHYPQPGQSHLKDVQS